MGCREDPSGDRLLLVQRNFCVDTANLIKQWENSVDKLFVSVKCRKEPTHFPNR